MIVEVALFTAVVWGLLSVSPAGSTFVGTKSLSQYKLGLLHLWLNSCSHVCVSIQEPSIGDVMLSDIDSQGTSAVMIYFTDGIHKPQWGTICAKRSLPNIAKVLCRQLGQGDGHKSLGTPPLVSMHCQPGWISGIIAIVNVFKITVDTWWDCGWKHLLT